MSAKVAEVSFSRSGQQDRWAITLLLLRSNERNKLITKPYYYYYETYETSLYILLIVI